MLEVILTVGIFMIVMFGTVGMFHTSMMIRFKSEKVTSEQSNISASIEKYGNSNFLPADAEVEIKFENGPDFVRKP